MTSDTDMAVSPTTSGPDYPRCGATNRVEPGTCGLRAGWGTPHLGVGRCRKHGGNTQSHVQKATEDQARLAAARWGEPIVTTGIDALLNLLYLWSGIEMFYRARIQDLAPDEFVWGDTGLVHDSDTGGVKRTSSAGVNMWVKLHSEATTKLADIAEQCVRAGIDERRVRLAEQQGALLVSGLRWLAQRLELSELKAQLFDQLVLEMFQHLDSGKIPAIERKKP